MAVVDKREIRFDADALLYCLAVSPKAAEGFGLKAMPVGELRLDPAAKIVEVVCGGEVAAVRIAAESLGALLVSHCVRSKIPIPRIAGKRVRVEADCLVLEFVTQFDKTLMPEVAEPRPRPSIRSWK